MNEDFKQPLILFRDFNIPMSIEVEVIADSKRFIITLNITDDILKNSDIDISKNSLIDILSIILKEYFNGKCNSLSIMSIKVIKYEEYLDIVDF